VEILPCVSCERVERVRVPDCLHGTRYSTTTIIQQFRNGSVTICLGPGLAWGCVEIPACAV